MMGKQGRKPIQTQEQARNELPVKLKRRAAKMGAKIHREYNHKKVWESEWGGKGGGEACEAPATNEISANQKLTNMNPHGEERKVKKKKTRRGNVDRA